MNLFDQLREHLKQNFRGESDATAWSLKNHLYCAHLELALGRRGSGRTTRTASCATQGPACGAKRQSHITPNYCPSFADRHLRCRLRKRQKRRQILTRAPLVLRAPATLPANLNALALNPDMIFCICTKPYAG